MSYSLKSAYQTSVALLKMKYSSDSTAIHLAGRRTSCSFSVAMDMRYPSLLYMSL